MVQEYWTLRDAVVAHEQILLRTLAFDLDVDLPYRYLLNYLRTLRAGHGIAHVVDVVDVAASNGAQRRPCGVLVLAW